MSFTLGPELHRALLLTAPEHRVTQAMLFESVRTDCTREPLTEALQQARLAQVGTDSLRDGRSVDELTAALTGRMDAPALQVFVSELAAAVVTLAHELRDQHEALPRRVDGLERALNSL